MNGGMHSLEGLGAPRRLGSGGGGDIEAPSDIAGLLLWYKTEALVSPVNGSPITSWPDASGNGRDGTPGGTGLVYRTGVVNSRAIVEFTGDHLSFTAASLGTAHTVLFVFRPLSGFSDGVVLGGNATGKYAPYLDTTDIYYRAVSTDSPATVAHGGLTTNTAYLLGVVRSGTAVSFYKNGSQLSTTQTLGANTSLTIQQLSGLATDSFELENAQIAEVIVYDTALSTDNRQAIEGYLNQRFSLY